MGPGLARSLGPGLGKDQPFLTILGLWAANVARDAFRTNPRVDLAASPEGLGGHNPVGCLRSPKQP